MKDWKLYVTKLCELGCTNSSKEIAKVINKFSEFKEKKVSSSSVAAVRANWTRKNRG